MANNEAANPLQGVANAAQAFGGAAAKGAAAAAGAIANGAGQAVNAAKDAANGAAGAAQGVVDSLSAEQMSEIMSSIYAKVCDGVPTVSSPIDDVVDDYVSKNDSVEAAARSFINYQIAKCTTSGFLTGLGGVLTLPVALPANITSVLYVQMRMVAGLARMGGYDLSSDQVQTLVYVCLTGTSANAILKKTGIAVGNKIALSALKRLPGKVLIAINKKVGFRLLTKFGTKGVINLGKMIPVAGGVVSGALDGAETKAISKAAYSLFIEGTIPEGKQEDIEDFEIDIDAAEV